MARPRSQPLEIILLLFLLPIFSSGVDKNPCVKREETWECANLNYIPVLPPNTTNLRLVSFRVPVLSRDNLSNLTGLPLKVLEFRRPMCNNVTTDVFTDMKHLRTLIIKIIAKIFPRTRTLLPRLFHSLHFTSITTVFLEKVYLESLTGDLFAGLRNTTLQSLHLRNCGLTIFNGSSVSQLTTLQTLDLSLNGNLVIESWGHLTALTHLNLNETYIDHLPEFQSAYPELRTLELSLSSEHSLSEDTFEGLPKLTELKIQAEKKLSMAPGTIGSNLQKLQSVSISGTPAVMKLELADKTIFSSSLRRLELRHISLMSFNDPLDCRNLTDLTLSSFVAEHPTQLIRILPTLQQLTHLEVSNSQLKAVPASICNLTRLNRLNLYGNTIYSWTNKDCRLVMGNLEEFSLANNNIKKLNKSSFSEVLLNNSRLMWDLSGNSYFCSCNLLWFRDWLKKMERRIIGYPQRYRCKLPSGVKIKIPKYTITWDYCINKYRPSTLILLAIGLGALSLVIIGLSVVAYVQRWLVRYWCYMLSSRFRRYKTLPDNIEYVYDAFVCYHSSDIGWVREKLIPQIEDAEGYKLCLHERDFMVGRDIADNIADSVQMSSKVVLVLTPEFATSKWCQYEATLAEQRLLDENRDMVVPVLLKEIPDHIQSRRLATLLKRKTYLEWTDDAQGEELFWKRFADILRKPSVKVEN